MAFRAVGKVKADWSSIASRVNPKESAWVKKLQSKVDATATKAASLPETLPKIDWAHYKENASDPKLVEELQKRYTSLKVEVPKVPANRIEELELARKQDLERFKKFKAVAQSYIEASEELKEKFAKMIPVKDMTYEDWTLTFPQWSTSIESPSVAPHFGRIPGLSREEAAAFDQPDPVPYATKTAWKDWEEKKKRYVSP